MGRAFFFAGLLCFIHVFAWVGVLTWGNTPVFGTIFGGNSALWGYVVVVPMVTSVSTHAIGHCL